MFKRSQKNHKENPRLITLKYEIVSIVGSQMQVNQIKQFNVAKKPFFNICLTFCLILM